MTASFNLLDEPWIRVTRLDGAPDEVSLLALFREVTDIAGIHGEIASQDVAILRLLLAISHRTMDGPEDLDTWREYWEDPERLGRDAAAYLERYRERFDLRDPDRPFFQVAGIHAASGKTSELESLIVDVPSSRPVSLKGWNPSAGRRRPDGWCTFMPSIRPASAPEPSATRGSKEERDTRSVLVGRGRSAP